MAENLGPKKDKKLEELSYSNLMKAILIQQEQLHSCDRLQKLLSGSHQVIIYIRCALGFF